MKPIGEMTPDELRRANLDARDDLYAASQGHWDSCVSESSKAAKRIESIGAELDRRTPQPRKDRNDGPKT